MWVSASLILSKLIDLTAVSFTLHTGKEMYIVRKGRLSVVSEDGSITFASLTDGAVFGELSVLNIQGNGLY